MRAAKIPNSFSEPVMTVPTSGCNVPVLDKPLVTSNMSQGPIVSDGYDGTKNAIFNGFVLDTNDYMYKRYQSILNTPVSTLNAQGFWMNSDGWIMKGNPGEAYLPVPNIIDIDNALGKPSQLAQYLQNGGFSRQPPTASALSNYKSLIWYAVAAIAVVIIYIKFIRK